MGVGSNAGDVGLMPTKFGGGLGNAHGTADALKRTNCVFHEFRRLFLLKFLLRRSNNSIVVTDETGLDSSATIWQCNETDSTFACVTTCHKKSYHTCFPLNVQLLVSSQLQEYVYQPLSSNGC
jgi:hypothetical protein